jgi:predicted nuclease of predicted toxin-antitoxin system
VKLKLDENLPVSLVDDLVQRGHDVDTVIDEGLTGADDPRVLAAAREDGRLLLTLDRGFGDIRRYPPGTHAGIAVLRPINGSAHAVVAAVMQLVDNHDLSDLAGTITVVQRGILRIRRPGDGPRQP